MGLAFYDEDKVLFSSSPLRTIHDGFIGSTQDKLIYIRNDDVSKYYTNIQLIYTVNVYQDLGVFGDSGWGVKFIYGERLPTEAEWDEVRSGDTVDIPDIGTTDLADTFTYHPIWVRVICPGDTPAQIREGQQLNAFFFERNVGA